MSTIKKSGHRSRRGRPSKYAPEMAERAYLLTSEAGLTDKQLAAAFGVNADTINEWKHEHSDFSESIKKGRDEFDSVVVEASLLKRANGIRFTEVTKEPAAAKDGSISMVVTKRVRKLIPPDVTAAIFWLKNRSRDRWRDKVSVEIEGAEGLADAIRAGRERERRRRAKDGD